MEQDQKKPLWKRHLSFLISHWLESIVFVSGAVTLWQILIHFPFTGDSNLPQPNEIGDMLGGVTAPFINLIAAMLVYRSFKAQIKANEIIHRELDQNEVQRSVEIIEKRIDAVEHELKNYHFEGYDTLANGSKAITGYWKWFSNHVAENSLSIEKAFLHFEHHFNKQYNLYFWLSYSIKRIEQNKQLPADDALYLKTRLAFLFNEYLYDSADHMKKAKSIFENANPTKVDSAREVAPYLRFLFIMAVYNELLNPSTMMELRVLSSRLHHRFRNQH